jgi:hypothetical protein
MLASLRGDHGLDHTIELPQVILFCVKPTLLDFLGITLRGLT